MYSASSFCAAINYNVSINSALLSLRLAISQYMVLPFILLQAKKDLNYFSKAIIRIGLIYLFIAFLQYVLVDYNIFTHVGMNIRYGDVRLYFPTALIVFLLVICFHNIFDKKSGFYFNLVIISLCIIFFTVITKGRMLMVSVIITLTVVLLMRKRNFTKKISLICIAIIGFILFLISNMGHDILALINTGQSTADNSSWLRDYGRSYYLSKLSLQNGLSSIFGYGFPPTDSAEGYSITHPIFQGAEVYPEDNGIIGYSVYFGLYTILLWLIILLYTCYVSYRIYCLTGDSSYFILPLIDVIPSISLVPMFIYSPFIFLLYYSYLRITYDKEMQ